MKSKIKFISNRYIKLFHSSKDSFWALLFSLIFSLFLVIGLYMDKRIIILSNDANIGSVACIIFLTFLFSLGVAELYLRFRTFLVKRISEKQPEITSGDTGYYFICLIIIMLMWFPVLLAYYPGLFAYDVMGQIPQSAGSYSTHHPLIHTFILQFFYYIVGEQLLGSYNRGMVCYSLIQMLILSMAIAYMHLFLYRMKVGRTLRILLVVYTSIFPVYSVLSISMTKDIIFAAFYLVSFLCLCYWEAMPDFFEKKHLGILYIISIVGAVLFRNNGIYVIIILLILGFIILRKEKKDILFLTIMGVILSVFLLGILKYSVDADDLEANDMLSVPYQQLSYVYNIKNDELSFDDKHEIESFIPGVAEYLPHRADPVKKTGQVGGRNIGQFISLYFRMLVRYPDAYVKAFLHNTMGYWYLFDTSNAEIYGSGPGIRQGYLLTDTKKGFNVVHVSFFPALEDLYENLFSLNEYQHYPLLFILCSMAAYIWMIVLCVFFAINLKYKHAALPIILLLGYIITIFAGPCAIIRYAFPVISCIPPLYVTTFLSQENFIGQKVRHNNSSKEETEKALMD